MDKPTTTYATILRIGRLGWIDVQCASHIERFNDKDVRLHAVEYRLIDSHGDVTKFGCAVFTGDNPDEQPVFDDDGQEFLCLEAAIQEHARSLLEIVPGTARWSSKPPTHELWDGTATTAFEPEAEVQE